ncbi:MAG: putative MFS family arabinose efflux permease [Planctomycetota bacterium]
MSIAVGLTPSFALFMIGGVGWRWTYVILGAIVVAVIVPAARLLPRHEPHGAVKEGKSAPNLEGVSLRAAIRTRAYVATGLVVMLHAATVTAVHFHSQPLFKEFGFGQVSAAAGMSIFAASMLVASLSGGWFVDRTAWHVPFVTSTCMLSASMLLLAHGGSLLIAHAGMALLGVAQGLGGVAIVPTVARCFGRAHFGAVRGSLATLTVAGASTGPLVLGWAADYSDGFSSGLVALACAGPPCALLVWVSLRPTKQSPAQ